MAIKLVAQTNPNQLLKIISVQDTAIDWDKSYANEELLAKEEDGDDPVATKKRVYQQDHDQTKIVIKEGEQPTLFIFKHPRRADVARSMRQLYSMLYSQNEGKNFSLEMFNEVFQKAYIGVEEGFGEVPLERAPRDDKGLLTASYMQALEDANVVSELALAFVTLINKKKASGNEKK